MKFEIHDTLPHTLPMDDAHPYRSGAWRPQHVEYDAWDLDVEGRIPDDLNGVYIRNTENPLHPPIERYHPFDGDGMLHSISFEAGQARYANRFVRTDGLAQELAAGESLLFSASTRGVIERFALPQVGAELPYLTDREGDVLRLLARGMSNGEIATKLFVSVETVKSHVASILTKLRVRDRTQAVIAAYESGFVAPGAAE